MTALSPSLSPLALLLVSAFFAAAAACAVRVRAWALGEQGDEASFARMFYASFPAIVVSFLAATHLDGALRGASIAAAVAFPIAVSLVGRQSLLNGAFGRIYVLALLAALALWGLYELLVWLGVDMERNPYRT